MSMAEQELDGLSDDAKACAGGWFGMMKPGESGGLTFKMAQSRPTARAQAALDELLAAGVIEKADVYRSPAVTYRPVVDTGPFMRWLWANMERPDLKWPVTEPIPHTPA
jgi:hypothetical protein